MRSFLERAPMDSYTAKMETTLQKRQESPGFSRVRLSRAGNETANLVSLVSFAVSQSAYAGVLLLARAFLRVLLESSTLRSVKAEALLEQSQKNLSLEAVNGKPELFRIRVRKHHRSKERMSEKDWNKFERDIDEAFERVT
jgi:hypothetical protein